MKRKRSNTTDLRSFLQRAAAKKKQSQDQVEQEQERVIPSTDQSRMQLIVFQGQNSSEISTIPLDLK
jgi:hypothetical protein